MFRICRYILYIHNNSTQTVTDLLVRAKQASCDASCDASLCVQCTCAPPAPHTHIHTSTLNTHTPRCVSSGLPPYADLIYPFILAGARSSRRRSTWTRPPTHSVITRLVAAHKLMFNLFVEEDNVITVLQYS